MDVTKRCLHLVHLDFQEVGVNFGWGPSAELISLDLQAGLVSPGGRGAGFLMLPGVGGDTGWARRSFLWWKKWEKWHLETLIKKKNWWMIGR